VDYFDTYPVDPDEIIGIAASMRSSASDVDNTVANVTSAGDQAEAAVDGALSFPLSTADRPVIQTGSDIVETARFAAGALLLFATGISTFNARVEELNASLPSGAPNWDEVIAPQKREYEQAKADLDDVAKQVSGMLGRGPNAADIAFLDERGLLPSVDIYDAAALQSAFDKTGMNFPGAAFPIDDLTPAEVAAWWASLTAAEKMAVMSQRALRLGRIDGLPAEVRDEANRIALTERLDDLERQESEGTLTDEQAQELRNVRAVRDQLAVTESGTDPITLEPLHAQLLIFEPAEFGGDGRAAIVVGDADTADNVAWTVPGLSAQVDSYMGDQVGRSLSLYDETRRLNAGSETTAVVAWVGYDAPSGGASTDSAGVATRGQAEAGAEILAQDVAGLRASRGEDQPHLTVVGHSYGATTVAISGRDNDLQADDIVLIGSPGTGDADEAGELGVDAEHVWVGANSRDAVADIGGTGWANVSEVSLGNDPAEDDFGANRFRAEAMDRGPYDDLDDHSKYFERQSESLYNMANIVNGDYNDVQQAEHRYDPWYDGVQDPEWERHPELAPR
jgi:pimeloyl-ACP methyl ester carboxylesterase